MSPVPNPSFVRDWPRPLGFVFSGGGAYGSVHVGMMKAMSELGICPDIVVGTSVGSLNGAMLASHPTDAHDRLSDLWALMSRKTVIGHGPISATLNLLRTGSLSTSNAMSTVIAEQLDHHNIEQLPLTFAAVATEAISGQPTMLRSGPIQPALLASSALPGVFPPVEIDGHSYLDGGLSANVPVHQTIQLGARSVVAFDASPAGRSELPSTPFHRFVHTMVTLVRNQSAHAIDALDGETPVLLMPRVTPPDMGAFNFRHTQWLIDAAYEVAMQTINGDTPEPPALDRGKPRRLHTLSRPILRPLIGRKSVA